MSERKIELSIIVISYNTKTITQNCLDSIVKSLKKSQMHYEIIMVDNASTDGSQDQISKFKSQNHNLNLKTLFNKKNVGFAKANNQAAKVAEGEYILFLNSDVLVLEDAIEKLLTFYKQRENTINFLGGKLLNKNLTSQPSCGPFYSLSVIFAALFLRGDYWSLTRYSPAITREVDWISGACILTKNHYFSELGGFDENIFMYMDEIDLLYRAKKRGFRVFFYPEARFIHLGSASSQGRTYPILQVYRGFIFFYKKHYSQQKLYILKIMLQLKALVGIFLGRVLNNYYLTNTYEEAFKIAQMA